MDRRHEDDDRRKIDRLSSPPVRVHFKQINMFVHYISLLTFFAAIFNIYNGIRIGTSTEITFGLFMAVIFGMLTVALYSYSKAIHEFLNNESLSNLDRAMERQSLFWFLLFIISFIYTIVYFIFG